MAETPIRWLGVYRSGGTLRRTRGTPLHSVGKSHLKALAIAICLVVLTTSCPAQTATGGGQTASQPSSWTIDSLKAHFDELRTADKELSTDRDKRYEQRFQAQESAQASYKTSSNEFRGTLSDQAGRFVTRSELGGYLMGFVIIMGVLAAWMNRLNRATQQVAAGKSP